MARHRVRQVGVPDATIGEVKAAARAQQRVGGGQQGWNYGSVVDHVSAYQCIEARKSLRAHGWTPCPELGWKAASDGLSSFGVAPRQARNLNRAACV